MRDRAAPVSRRIEQLPMKRLGKICIISMRERISMAEQPTIETLQAELIALKEEHEKMIAQMDAQKQEAAKQAEDLKRARDLNAQLMAKSTVAEKSEEPDPYEGMTAEQALEAILPEVVDKVAAERAAKEA